MYVNVTQKMGQLPSDYAEDLLASIRQEFIRSNKTIVVLDDDPTGTQTCQDVTVLTNWRVALITDELKKKPAILFILTNSRSLPEPEAVALTREVGRNLNEAAIASGRELVVISRSDSTLRGHFPAEVDAIAQTLNRPDAVVVLVPAFLEGARYTIGDVHYLVENEVLVPVSETPFARDVVFGYRHANLKQWVEEKTGGRVRASDVQSISLETIRIGGPKAVSETLMACSPGSVCVVNAASYRDLEVVVMGLMQAEKAGKLFLYRSSATLVPIRAGMLSGQLFIPPTENTGPVTGYLVVVGSHVPKTTGQLNWLLTTGTGKSIEVNVGELLNTNDRAGQAATISQQVDTWLADGENVVIHTSRKQEVGADAAGSLTINAQVSDFLVSILSGLTIRPKFIVAKGGITSSDLATGGLSAEKAEVLGAVIPGVPVWQMDANSKFPGICYVVFPGNVGDETALAEVCRTMNQ
ncbi:four-carbon acid sugar kinase family protein [Spirosoma spitsbergense]|uniref:four-carbon acid sugar kinase family protein n=1 Tax=Spirosoma spitsbergense TaxID=431554 RepID=UPI0003759672|nr:four-carbon acid sugar kinase family protein [Spirosoma spitsbergense]